MISRRAGLVLTLVFLGVTAYQSQTLDWGLPEIYEDAEPLHMARDFWGTPTESVDLKPSTYRIPTFTAYVFFLEQAARYFVDSLMGRIDSLNDFRQSFDQNLDSFVYHARWINALLAGLLVFPMYLAGRRLGGEIGGWLAVAGILAVPQVGAAGRVAGPDALFVFCSAWVLAHGVAMIQEGRRQAYLWAGLWIGFAATSHYAGLLWLIVYTAGHAWGRRKHPKASRGLAFWEGLGVFAVAVVLTMPYSVLDPQGLLRGMEEAAHEVGFSRLGSEGVSPVDHGLALLRKEWTLPLGLFGLAGLILAGVRRVERGPALALLGLVAGVFLVIWFRAGESSSLLLVLLPAWVACGAALPKLLGKGRVTQPAGAALALITLVGMNSLGAHASWERIQVTERPDSRVAVRAWLTEKMGPETAVVSEFYGPDFKPGENALVLPFNSLQPHMYDAVYVPELYAGIDYVVLSSSMFERYRRAPAEYVQQVYFYEHLPRGFELVQVFAQPAFAGPEVRVFRRRDSSRLNPPTDIPREFFAGLKGRGELAEFFSQLGVLYSRQGRESYAFHLLQEAVGIDPQNSKAWSDLGSVQLSRDRIDDALFSLRKARDLDPENARVRYNLGVLHQRNSEWSQAEGEFAKAIDLDPTMEVGFLSLARVLIQAERYPRARLTLREFLHRFPRSPRRAQAEEALATLSTMGPGKP